MTAACTDTICRMCTCGSESRGARLEAALVEELRQAAEEGWVPGRLWWLSFVDPTLVPPVDEQVPGGRSFLGVAVVHAIGPAHAVRRSYELGANPGGEVQIFPVPDGYVPVSYRNRLLNRRDLADLGEL